MGIRHRLQGRERFRGDDEKGLRRVETLDGFGEVGTVDVGNEAKPHGALAVIFQRLVSHHGPEIRAADAYVDDVVNALAGVSFPGPAPHPVGEVRHLVEHGVDLGHHVFAVYDDGRASWRP